MTLRCSLCGVDAYRHAVITPTGDALCPPCANPPRLTTRALLCLVAAGALVVCGMVGAIVAVCSWGVP